MIMQCIFRSRIYGVLIIVPLVLSHELIQSVLNVVILTSRSCLQKIDYQAFPTITTELCGKSLRWHNDESLLLFEINNFLIH